mgnify:FL=1
MFNDLAKKISELRKKNIPNGKIIESLKKEGFSSQDIYDSMSNETQNVADELEAPSPISEEMDVEEQEEPKSTIDFGMPSLRSPPPSSIPSRQNIEQIEEIAESIVEEKWEEVNSIIGDLNLWKEKTSSEIEAIKQEILRIRNSFENLNNAVVGRVEGYQSNIMDLGAEIRALNKIMEKIIQPLTSNVKELSLITEKLKKK